MKRRLKELCILLAGLGGIGLFVLVSGIAPINASGGHWPITRWFLDYASDRSVDFHSSGIEPPPLDQPGMIRLGAATYDSNCRWCHGRPGSPAPVVAGHMTPSPPYLPGTPLDKEPRELFYIVKHGIKFAGMPAWPTQARDDDVWPVVAFLQQLSQLDAEDYYRQVRVETESDSAIERLAAQACAACHGTATSPAAGPRVPLLASQSKAYLEQSLQAFKTGARHSGIMQPIAARLTDPQIAKLAAHYAGQTQVEQESTPAAASDSEPTASDEQIELGKSLAHRGDRQKKIAACVACHGPGTIERSPDYPKLAGQPAWYLKEQLDLLQRRARGGTARVDRMHSIADKLSTQEIEALANYYAQLPLEN
ncbi:Cytochrome c4 precursor [Rosistilla ulvae]|uniref:Cytochrome c4 n=1 Tax=Rosistilla ulvae TaxID=1930277 RepID=A0A517M2P1_9BACT|nr:c-type cytochrome [Rosistilla ulvae]QDS89142.1 Cytochrome c4 precursor [Rosistilla ulvae]